MSLIYKMDILAALKEKGYNTTVLRRDKLLSEGTIQALREKKPISWANIEKLCSLLNCQPGDIMEYVPDEEGIK
ncbi:MAG: helix-turn-helix domain-containing protein [Acutalibacteraceae bacterium]